MVPDLRPDFLFRLEAILFGSRLEARFCCPDLLPNLAPHLRADFCFDLGRDLFGSRLDAIFVGPT
jgi:hypothetical protein